MTATNHALTGALLGLSITHPYLSLPAALLSHFVCDALPHFGAGASTMDQKWFVRLLIAEAIVCAAIVMVLVIVQPHHWQYGALGAFLAASPDFMWINKYRRARAGIIRHAKDNWLLRVHADIQWFERPIGALFEAAWAISAVILLKLFIV